MDSDGCSPSESESYYPDGMTKKNDIKKKHIYIYIFISLRQLTKKINKISMSLPWKQNFGFIKRVDKGWITTVKDLESWRFER